MCVFTKVCVSLAVLVVVAHAEDEDNLCRIDKDAWMQFCYDPGYRNGLRRCNAYEPADVIVRPGCRVTDRYSNKTLAPTQCVEGNWENVFSCPSATPEGGGGCKLEGHTSVNYNCLGPDNTSRLCTTNEPEGTIVQPECNNPSYSPNFYSRDPLPLMKCVNGNWDSIITCSPVCGKPSVSEGLPEERTGERLARKGEVPWHAIVYIDLGNGYEEICGGTLVTNNIVISAAHAFWSTARKTLYTYKYAVAVGKLYRLWNDERDADAQKSAVKTVHVPDKLRGDFANYHSDIAILIMATPFKFNVYVRPVCLHFNDDLEKWQTEVGRLAEVAVWQNGETEKSAALKVTKFSHINTDQCYAKSHDASKNLITADKICIEHNKNDSKLCVGDTGAGLIFTLPDGNSKQYYMRGVVSDLPIVVGKVCSGSFIVVTQLTKHEDFIKKYV